jgi:pimeloyl-ACP methyl ester carboxylesterase
MSKFVLLHGAFHGGWCWALVADRLRRAGHVVHTPTQTGLGERRHLLSRDITVETFVLDLVNVMEAEELTDAVLVGHSFGGNAISGAADRVPHRLRHLIYLDSMVLENGETPFAGLSPEVAQARRQQALTSSNGLSVPVPAPSVFGVPDGPGADWLMRRLTPHPLNTYETPLRLRHPLGNGLPCTYIACVDPIYPALESSRQRVRDRPGWTWRDLATGHDAMITAPAALSELLIEIAG